MDKVSPEFVADIQAVIEKHGIIDIQASDALGQTLDQIPNGCLGNDVGWHLGGLIYSYVYRTNAVETLKQMVEAIGNKRLNYNDMDCDMWGKHFDIYKECMTCSARYAKDKKTPKPEDCTRCNGTRVDPEYKDSFWLLVFDNHGNANAFILKENCLGYELHIRKLPYNQSRTKRVEILKTLCVEAVNQRYKSDHELLRYHDARDEGFVLSMTYDKDMGRKEEALQPRHKCEASLYAHHALSDIVEHFPCVIKEESKDKEEPCEL